MKKIKENYPLMIRPYKESKVWGIDGIGEYWYGKAEGEQSSVLNADNLSVKACDFINENANEILGNDVVNKYGRFLPLIKILTPKGRLSVQFHDQKNELWIITGIDKKIAGNNPKLIIGFSPAMIDVHGKGILEKYKKALCDFGLKLNLLMDVMIQKGYKKILDEEKDIINAAYKVNEDEKIKKALNDLIDKKKYLDTFYNYLEVKIGDVVPVPQGTLHALGPGIEIVEPQIAGPTQSTEDGATYPIRYYFPDFPVSGANKKLDIDRVNEILPEKWKSEPPRKILQKNGVKIERLPGGFENKGMAVDRIILSGGSQLSVETKSYHMLTSVKGEPSIKIGKKIFKIPAASKNGDMMLIPALVGKYVILCAADTEIIDTYTPV
ncbi:MAG: hypothetical protein HQL29_02045 [Candidatus Omnitrophica bacterium]|nr:hypothetical protein [Candidatus Omnitrophota bacterium]